MSRSSCCVPAALILCLAWTVPVASATDYSEHFGISIGAPIYNNQVTFTEQVAQDCAEMGVRWIRVEFIAQADIIDYTKYDEIINRANAYNLKVLGLLTYQTKDWYLDTGNWAEDWWQDMFRDRCVEVVNHYRNFASGPIRFWEIWNEPDSLGNIPAAKFGRMLAITYPAIKAADSRATIVSGGLTGYWSPPFRYMEDVYDSTYFQDYYATYGIYPFDIFGLHPYVWTLGPDEYLESRMNGYYGLRRLLNIYGDDYKRIWFTEYGWNSSPTADSSINPGGDETYNEWLQGEFVDRMFTIDQELEYPTAPYDDFGPYVEKTFLFCYKDFDLGTPQTREYFGTVRENLERKPLFYRYKNRGSTALKNLALDATVTASGQTAPHEAPDRACDGTCFTRWSSSSPSDDHTLTLDFGATCEVHEIRISHAEMGHGSDTQNTTSFAIQTSSDGVNWSMVSYIDNSNREPVNIITFAAPRKTRYVQMWITDAGLADGTARVPEFEVLGRPFEVANVKIEYQFATSLGGLGHAVSDSDLIQGDLAAFESGDIDPDHDVYAYEFDSGTCLDMLWDTPLSGFWHGYTDPSPAAHLPKFTDGLGDPGVVLRDFGRAAAVLRYDFATPTDVKESRVYAANSGMDGRVFQHYDVYVSTDFGATYDLLAAGVKTDDFGATNNGAHGASLTRVHAPLSGTLVEDATNLRYVFFDTHVGDTFYDPWQSNRNESVGYGNNCPDVEPQDMDGYAKAFSAPTIVEIDVFERLFGDTDADDDIDLDDFAEFEAWMTGPDVDYGDAPCRYLDAPTRDHDVDLEDMAAFQQAFQP